MPYCPIIHRTSYAAIKNQDHESQAKLTSIFPYPI